MRKLLQLITMISLLAMISLMPAMSAHATPADGYVLDDKEGFLPTPLGYSVVRVLKGNYKDGMLKNPEDLYIDDNDMLYIADTENNRIVKMNKNGDVTGIFGTEQDKLGFNKPMGVFAEKDGDIYIADSGKKRIVHLAPDGKFIEQFEAPKSNLIDKDFVFTPSKVAVDSRGYLFVQSGNDYHGLLQIDGNNQFQGYIAPNKLDFDLVDWIKRVLATKDQRDAAGKRVPPNHKNFDIDQEEGYIYTAIENTREEEIKKFNFLGINVYPADKSYGEYDAQDGLLTIPRVVDIAVDKQGIITTVDINNRKVYQYDQEGNMLAAFGGNGLQQGFFTEPIAVDVDSEGLLYVLDRNRGEIQVLKANPFTELVHTASYLYNEGKYDEALKPWKEVLKMDSNYYLAHRGVGKALFKQEEWKSAMNEFYLGEDKANYSKAFGEYRHVVLRQQFGWILLIGSAILVLLYYTIIRLRGYARQLEYGHGKRPSIENAVLTLFAPSEGFYRIQTRPQYIPALIILLLVIIARFIEIYFTSFQFQTIRPQFANLYLEMAKILVPLLTWVIAAWAITSIMDGESKFKQIAVAACYAMIPYVILTIIKTLISNIMTLDEVAVWDMITSFMWAWIIIIFIVQIMVMNTYSFGRTIWVIIVTLLTMIAFWAVCMLFYMLLNHVFNFIKEVVLELYIRRY